MMALDEISFIVTTLERMQDKMEKQDNKIDMIVQAMQQLVKVDTENQEIKSSLLRAFKRLEEVEKNQMIDGCPAHKNFISIRNEQVKKYDEKIKDFDVKYSHLEERLGTIEKKSGKTWEAITYKVIEWGVLFALASVALRLGVK